jgi:hypothetical protein
MKINQFVRQGDVFVRKIKKLPPSVEQVNNEDTKHYVILAHGEVTGHSHKIDLASPNIKLWTDGLERYMEILEEKEVNLIHEEHRKIPFEPGSYYVWQPREYVAPDIERKVED